MQWCQQKYRRHYKLSFGTAIIRRRNYQKRELPFSEPLFVAVRSIFKDMNEILEYKIHASKVCTAVVQYHQCSAVHCNNVSCIRKSEEICPPYLGKKCVIRFSINTPILNYFVHFHGIVLYCSTLLHC